MRRNALSGLNAASIGALLLSACAPPPFQLPLGGDRQCSWCIDSVAPACWSAHDNAYWVGGTEQDRFAADAEWLACMALSGVPEWWAWGRYQVVRKVGASSWKLTELRSRRPPSDFDPCE